MAATRNVGRSGDQRIDGELAGVGWAGSNLTFSFPDATDDYDYGVADLTPLGTTQQATVRSILEDDDMAGSPADGAFSIEGLTRLSLKFIDGGSGAGILRYANSSEAPTAYAYYPYDGGEGGDSFYGPSGRSPATGNYDHYTFLHETGHALGLKHGHETQGFGALPAATDSMEYSVMTYRSFVGSDARYVYNETWGYAQTYMMYDIAARQHMYGADFGTNAGDTTYSWRPDSGTTFIDSVAAITPGANRIFATIWDGNGTDSYDLSAYGTAVSIDLAPGGYSLFSAAQTANLGGGPNNGYARGNIFNALRHQGDARSLIENAIGGSGADTIAGNSAANRLEGGAGADTLSGLAGADMLLGGDGGDVLSGGAGDDVLSGDAGIDRFDGGDGTDTILFRQNTQSVRVDLAAGTVTFPGQTTAVETLTSIENVSGGSGADILLGGAGANLLRGVDGADRLTGRGGGDTLVGGKDDDIFILLLGDSTSAARDVISAGDGALAFEGAGASGGDRIDLSGIDADTGKSGDQAFSLGGVGKGRVSLVSSGSDSILRCNIDADSAFELELRIADGSVASSAYKAIDFVL